MPSAALGKGAILIVADGPLQMIPFALLPDPGNPNRRLGSVHNIAVEPSASVLARIRENPAPATDGRILIVAEPVFSRSTSDRRLASLPPLPMSRVEAEQISKLASGRAGALMGFLATRDGFRKTAAGAFSVIHIATHTLLDDRHPDLSGLVLSLVDREGHSQDGFLPLLDIYKLRLRAHLVVLSACDTYIGKDLRGEGLLGLARGFLYAGARQVVASLWKVDDRATAVFMQRFYTALLHDNLAAPEALRRAQEEVSQEPAWRSPRYWAGFVLAGDLQ